MNSITLMGNLTKDPELSTTSTGKTLCRFSIAVSRGGEEGTDFFECQAWNKTAETIAKFFTKGKKILVQGRVQISDREKDGQKRRFWTVIINQFHFCGTKQDSGEATSSSPYQPPVKESKPISQSEALPPDDDGLPF